LNYPTANINLKNLSFNLKYLHSISNQLEIMPVIKADAYGHGAIKVAEKLEKLNVKCVCVATQDEIIELFDSNIKMDVLHLGKFSKNLFEHKLRNKLIITIHNFEEIETIKTYVKTNHSMKDYKIRCHLKVDTGMNRMGCKPKDFMKVYSKIISSELFVLEGIYSHLACSEDEQSKYNLKQINMFDKLINNINDSEISYHILNSGGLFNYSEYKFNKARIGLSLYGVCPILNRNHELKPVMELKAPIVLIKKIKSGESVGYGFIFTAKEDMTIAIIQCGYADALIKCFEGNGYVFNNGMRFEIVGKISMDLLAIDCKDYDFNLYDQITLWGGEQKKSRLEYLSLKYNAIPYEFLTSISRRVKRRYIDK